MSLKEGKKPNQLINEKSPYLLQHAYNPVAWYPWGNEAFNKAKAEKKPVFLSIGYSTCHWCHVMERESFEDEQVAEVLNQSYIAIKVDREERPDIDHVYMTACQALTGQGGWPLTIIMTPDCKPFFAGTYFPKLSRYGRLGLMDILTQISDKWVNERDKILEASEKILAHIEPNFSGNKKEMMPKKWILSAYEGFTNDFDESYGGFGHAPKFPTPHQLLFLLRFGRQQHDRRAVEMVCTTLNGMRKGGIYDHIGGGFARYSTDEQWLVPHFEKMLYDNALLAFTYLEAFQVTKDPLYRETVEDILTYVLRDMQNKTGGFFSAEDADSEGKEGRFYVWKKDEIESILGAEDAHKYCALFDITEEGNFEGFNIPNLIYTDNQDLEIYGSTDWKKCIRQWNQKLFSVRENRVHPYKDDKILTAWNGLMIAALAKAGGVLQNEAYVDAAKRAYQFIGSNLVDKNGRLLARFRDGEAKYLAYADDYAYVIFALTELYEATFNPSYLRDAMQYQEDMIRLFWDNKEDGFFLYGEDGENLIAKPKEIYDGATPSANSVGAYNLLRLAHISGKHEFETYGLRILEAFSGIVEQYPSGYTFYLMAAQFAYSTSKEIVVAGRADSEETMKTIQKIREKYLPECVVVFHPDGKMGVDVESIVPYVRDQQMIDDKLTLYICENFACQTPRTDIASVIEAL